MLSTINFFTTHILGCFRSFRNIIWNYPDLGTADSRGVDQREGQAVEGEGGAGGGEGVLDWVVGQHVAPAVQAAPGWDNNFICNFAQIISS